MLIECVASVNRSSFCVNCWRQDTINCWPSLEAHVFYRTSSRESAQKRLALAARLLVQFTSRRKSWYLDVILFLLLFLIFQLDILCTIFTNLNWIGFDLGNDFSFVSFVEA